MLFIASREIPEPYAWESRENYNSRTGQQLDPADWFELVATTVIRHDGVIPAAAVQQAEVVGVNERTS